MCPDDQILSVYFDGELPSPWKEKMEAHLGSCLKCRARFEQFRRCSQILKGPAFIIEEDVIREVPEMPGMELVKDRVWQNLILLKSEKWRQNQEKKLWSRTVAVPLPVIAAVVVILFTAFVLTLSRQPAPALQNQNTLATTGMMDMQGIVPVSDMHEVLQYLGNQDTTDIVIIRLPESRSFSSSGEPTILKAADYSRRNSSP